MDITKLIARGQLTVVDLNDATALQVWLENSSADVQVFSSDNGTYVPDYSKTNAVITPKVYLTGSSTEQVAAGKISDISYTLTGVKADNTTVAISTNATDYVVNTTNTIGTLTIKTNLAAYQAINIKFSANYNDGSGSATAKTPITAQTSITKIAGSTTRFDVQIMPSGFTFDKQVQGDNAATSFQAVATNGGVVDSTASYKWYRYNIDVENNTTNWQEITSTKVTDTAYLNANKDILTVTVNDVLNFQQYKVVATNKDAHGKVIKKNGVDETAEDWIYVVDKTDPYTVEVASTTGDKILNGTGDTTLFARVYRNGQIVETETTPTASRKFNYYWKLFDESGNDAAWISHTGDVFDDTTTKYIKTGNPIKVYADDVEPTNASSINGSRATVWCEVTAK